MAYRESSWRERMAERDGAPPASDGPGRNGERDFPRREFHYARASLGAAAYVPHRGFGVAGHLVYTAGALAPLVIGELVEDPGKRWRLMRLVSVGTALAYETLHVVREEQRRKEQEARLAECRSQCRGGSEPHLFRA
jgi:hypothetical protein